MAQSRQHPGICLGTLRTTTEDLSQGRRCCGRDSNRAPPEYESRALPLCQPARCNTFHGCAHLTGRPHLLVEFIDNRNQLTRTQIWPSRSVRSLHPVTHSQYSVTASSLVCGCSLTTIRGAPCLLLPAKLPHLPAPRPASDGDIVLLLVFMVSSDKQESV
jgi:hypothetical protein